jgi:hypothetical protein
MPNEHLIFHTECKRGGQMGNKRNADRKPPTKLQLKAKARQASKIAEIREALVVAGYRTAAEQAIALGVNRSTAWAFLNLNKRAGPSARLLKRILASSKLPPAVRRTIKEYVNEKIAGLYGHGKYRRRLFHDQFRAPISALPQGAGLTLSI